MPKLRKNHTAFRFLMEYWSKYCDLKDFHVQWVLKHAQRLCPKRGEILYMEGEPQKYVYLVTEGILARVECDLDTEKRTILSIALSGMALMTTDHLYSDTPSKGDIVALRSNTCVLRIAYRHLKEGKTHDPTIDTLIDVLSNKKRKQISRMLRIILGNSSFDRCILFAKENPALFHALYQKEIADMLQVSKSTVQSAMYYLIYGKKRKGN